MWILYLTFRWSGAHLFPVSFFSTPRHKGTRLLADLLNRRRGSISSFLDFFFLTSLCQFAFCLSVHCEWGSKKRVSLVLDLKIINPTPLAEFIHNNCLVEEAAPFHWKVIRGPPLTNSNMMSWKIPNCGEELKSETESRSWTEKQNPGGPGKNTCLQTRDFGQTPSIKEGSCQATSLFRRHVRDPSISCSLQRSDRPSSTKTSPASRSLQAVASWAACGIGQAVASRW